MSDMRDFNAPENIQGNISEEIRPQRDMLLEEENHSLGEFHVIESEESSNTGRILGALAVALLLGTAGGYAYYASQKAPAAPVANQVAAVTPPPAAAAPAPSQTADTSSSSATPAPSDAMPSSQPASSQPASAPAPSAPASSHRIRAARADMGASPAQPQAVTTEPNAPSLGADQSASAKPSAGNPSLARNEQNGEDVTAPANETPAVQAPAIPTPAATPAPAVQPAPAPSDQPAAQ